MDQYKRMSDEELISTLRKYNIAYGPIVGSTRTLYEKKLFEYERHKSKISPSFGSYDSKPQYSQRDYDNDNEEEEYYEEKITRTVGYPQAYQRTRTEYLPERREYSPGNSYQHVSQTRQSSGSSQPVEARRPIRELKKINEETGRTRYFPLWLQLFLLILFTGFLAYLYFVQRMEENPFKNLVN